MLIPLALTRVMNLIATALHARIHVTLEHVHVQLIWLVNISVPKRKFYAIFGVKIYQGKLLALI